MGPLVCNYGPPTPCSTPDMQARCDPRNGRWDVAVSSCNPPPPSCPETQPLRGTRCAVWSTPPECRYGNDICGPTIARCDPATSLWRLQDPPDCNPPPPVRDGGGAPDV